MHKYLFAVDIVIVSTVLADFEERTKDFILVFVI